jgi:hypothetical protein
MVKRLKSWLAAIGLAAALTLPALPAAATILWFGGEDTSITYIGAAATSTNTSSAINTSFSRSTAAPALGNGTSTADPPANRVQTPTFTACANPCWIHAVWGSSSITGTANEQGLLVRSPDGVARILLRQTGTSGQLKVSTRNAAGTITDLATASANLSASTPTAIDLEIVYVCSGSGGVALYEGGTQVVNYTGNPCTDSATSLDQVEFMGFNNFASGTNCASGDNCWSEMIAANEDTRSMHVATCALQAAGNTQAWTPSTLANVNKATISDISFVSTPTNNLLSQWTCPTSAPTGTWGVKSFSIEARNLASTTGPQNFDWSLRVSGADYLAGTTTGLTNAFANYRDQLDVSPATSTTWGISEIYNTSANQLGIGLKSLP